MTRSLRQKISPNYLITIIVIVFFLFLVSLVGFFFTSRPPLEGVQIDYGRQYLFFTLTYWSSIATSLIVVGLLVLSLLLRYWVAMILGVTVVGVICFAAYITAWMTFGGYSEVDEVVLDGRVYRLIQMFEVDGFYNYALCQCDSQGKICTCYHVYSSWDSGSKINLLASESPTSTITIKINDEVLCSYVSPLSFQGEHLDYGGYYYSECRSE